MACFHHETVCILNAGDTDGEVTITIFYTDREPGGPYRLKIPARRTQPVRFNNLDDPRTDPERHGFCQRQRKISFLYPSSRRSRHQLWRIAVRQASRRTIARRVVTENVRPGTYTRLP